MSETQGKKATQHKNKYNSANYDSLRIVVPKGLKPLYRPLPNLSTAMSTRPYWPVWGWRIGRKKRGNHAKVYGTSHRD